MTSRGSATAAFLSVFIAFVFSAGAQERSGDVLQQLERKEVTPETRPVKPPVIEKEEKEKKAKVKYRDAEKIFVKRFTVEGATLIDEQTIRSLVESFENKKLALEDINTVAEKITGVYRQRGYLIAYAFIPVQEIKDDTVVIKAIEGRVGSISVSGNKHYGSPFIVKHLEQARKDPSLIENRLERAILLLNEYPALNVKTSLRAGKKPGTTDILATASDKRYISMGLGYDNFGSSTISKHRASLSLEAGSLVADGDLLMLRGVTGLDKIDLKKLSYGRAEYLIPISFNGTKLGMYYADNVYEAGEYLIPLDINGKAHTAGIYLTHPFIKQRDRALEVRAGFDYKDMYDYMLDSLNSKDNVRSLNLGASYNFFDDLKGRNTISATWHQGIPYLLGGTGRDGTGTSRLGASGGFTKFTGDLARTQMIGEYSYALIRASGQLSNEELFSVEQFGIGGMGTVRGFDPSMYSGDSGYILGAEFYFSPFYPEKRIFGRKIGEMLKLVLFIDHGGVYRNNVQPGEYKEAYLTSAGAGIRVYGGNLFSFRVDCAVPRINGNFNAGNSVYYLQAMVNFE